MIRPFSPLVLLAAIVTSMAPGSFAVAQERIPAGRTPSRATVGGPMMLLRMPGIADDIGLSEKQKQDVKELFERYDATMRKNLAQLSKLSPEQRQTKVAEMREQVEGQIEEARTQVMALLTSPQKNALAKIDFDMRASMLLTNPRSIEELHLGDEQKTKLSVLFEDMQQKMQKAQIEFAKKSLDLLTPDQQDKLKAQLRAESR